MVLIIYSLMPNYSSYSLISPPKCTAAIKTTVSDWLHTFSTLGVNVVGHCTAFVSKQQVEPWRSPLRVTL